jgi:hypothetical protein
MAFYEDLEVDQGANAKWQLKLLDVDKSVRDLNGFTVRGKINRSYDADSDEAISFGVTIVEPKTSGLVELTLTNVQTDSLTRRRYVYDVEVEYLDSDQTIVERVLEGKLMVSRSVTK